MKCFSITFVVCAALCASLASAEVPAQDAGVQSPTALQAAAQVFLEQQTAGQPGRVRIRMGDPHPHLRLPACAQPEAFLPNGAHLAGRTLVGVRCAHGSHWQVFVPAEIRITAPVWVASHPLPAGSLVTATDLRQEMVDVTMTPAALVTQLEQALGKTMARPVAEGLPLRLDALKSQDTLAAGETVRVDCVGVGFTVSSEGRAVSSANPGQSVQVRMHSGQIVSGTVLRGKVVELRI